MKLNYEQEMMLYSLREESYCKLVVEMVSSLPPVTVREIFDAAMERAKREYVDRVSKKGKVYSDVAIDNMILEDNLRPANQYKALRLVKEKLFDSCKLEDLLAVCHKCGWHDISPKDEAVMEHLRIVEGGVDLDDFEFALNKSFEMLGKFNLKYAISVYGQLGYDENGDIK